MRSVFSPKKEESAQGVTSAKVSSSHLRRGGISGKFGEFIKHLAFCNVKICACPAHLLPLPVSFI